MRSSMDVNRCGWKLRNILWRNPASFFLLQRLQLNCSSICILQSDVMASGIIFRDAVCLTWWWYYIYACHHYQWIFWLYAHYRQLLITSRGILIGRHYVFLINIQHSRLQISCVYWRKMGLSGSEEKKKTLCIIWISVRNQDGGWFLVLFF